MEAQNIIASLIVIGAAAWLSRHIYGVFRSATGKKPVNTCGQCPKNRNVVNSDKVVEIQEKPAAEKH